MGKEEFLFNLRKRLSLLPPQDIEDRILFYREMIDDRIDDGMPEEAAVAAVGTVDDIANQVMSEIPLSKLVMRTVQPKKERSIGTIILLIAGAPLWLPILIAVFAVLLSLYITLWAVQLSFWAVNLSLLLATIVTVPAAVFFFVKANFAGGVFLIGAGIILLGITMLMFVVCRLLTRGLIWLAERFFYMVKSAFVRKEAR